MPRKKKPAVPDRRRWGTWSIDRLGQRYRARPPRSVDPKRTARYFDTRGEAEAWVATERQRLAERSLPERADVTVEEWLTHWYAVTADAADWSPRTRKVYATYLWHWSPLYHLPLAELRPSQVQTVVAQLRTTGPAPRPPGSASGRSRRPSPPLAADGIRKSAATLRRALAAAVQDGLIERNPADRLTLPKVVKQERQLWTSAQRRRLLAELERSPLAAVFALQFGCGLRIGEVLALKWDDAVDLEARVLTVRRTYHRGVVQEWPKGRRWRMVGLPPSAWAALLRHRDRSPLTGPEFVFTAEDGRPVSQQRVLRHLRAACARAGVPYHPSHAGRHVHATELLAAGVPLPDIAERLGHANGQITARLYIHPTDAGRQRATEVAERILRDTTAPRTGRMGFKRGSDPPDSTP